VLHFRGLVAKPDGSLVYEVKRTGKEEDGLAIGTAAGEELRATMGADIAQFVSDA
jgi:porphobilinogen deaminase